MLTNQTTGVGYTVGHDGDYYYTTIGTTNGDSRLSSYDNDACIRYAKDDCKSVSDLCKKISERNNRSIQVGTLVTVDTTHARALKTGCAKNILAHNGQLAIVKFYVGDCLGATGDFVEVKFLDNTMLRVRPCDIKVAPKEEREKYKTYKALGIKQIIVNDRAIIAKFIDGTKQVVVCSEQDRYDARVGILLCIAKHASTSKQVNALYNVVDNILDYTK